MEATLRPKPIPKLSKTLSLIAAGVLGLFGAEPITALLLGLRPTAPYPYTSLSQASLHSTLATFSEIVAGFAVFIGVLLTIQALRWRGTAAQK
jgi:hypothetical protein